MEDTYKKITSAMMLRAVSELYDYTLNRHNKIKTHADAENRIKQELCKFNPKRSAESLKLAMNDLGVLGFNIHEEGISVSASEIPSGFEYVKEFYKRQGYEIANTGGGCTAFQKSFDDDSYVMVTMEEGTEFPTHMEDNVTFGLYGRDMALMFTASFCGTEEMFNDDMVEFVTNYQPSMIK